jgi:D-xylose transport system substrate-binding protein
VTKNEVKTVVTQGYVKASEICGGDLAATCAQLGIA